jgi:anti-sigma factor RsiW
MPSGSPEPTAPRPIDCETAVRRLWDYLDGRLPAMTHGEVEAHLRSCELCPPHFEFAAEMRKALAESAQPLSTGEETRLRLRVRGALELVTSKS